jgi:hypothetical protein
MSTPQFTHRDRIKFACFNYALEKGLTEAQMVDLFTKAADTVRRTEKTAWADSFKANMGTALGVAGAAALAPIVGVSAAHLGYATGQGVKRLNAGYVPSPEEIHLMDETSEYEDAVAEIKRRVYLNRIKKQQNQTPSNRRLF